jgi:hypothetical protein
MGVAHTEDRLGAPLGKGAPGAVVHLARQFGQRDHPGIVPPGGIGQAWPEASARQRAR